MNHRDIFERLVYLDRDFIAGAYEAIEGKAPASQITKNEGISAGTNIPFFSGGLSATETRTFSVSTVGMLATLLPKLKEYPQLANPPVQAGAPSSIGWIEGELSVIKVILKGTSKVHSDGPKPRSPAYGSEAEKGSETLFSIRGRTGSKLVLITSPDYFVSGLASLLRINDVVTEEVSIPVRALIRVYAAKGSFQDWLSVPLAMYEHAQGA